MIFAFVRQLKGMDTARNHHLLGTPVRDGGLGLRYICWAYRRHFITNMQNTLCAHPDLFPVPLDKGIPRTHTPILTYVSLLQSLGAIPGVSLLPVKRRPGGLDLFDSEETDDGRLLDDQQPTMGQRDIAIKYCSPPSLVHLGTRRHPSGFS